MCHTKNEEEIQKTKCAPFDSSNTNEEIVNANKSTTHGVNRELESESNPSCITLSESKFRHLPSS